MAELSKDELCMAELIRDELCVAELNKDELSRERARLCQLQTTITFSSEVHFVHL